MNIDDLVLPELKHLAKPLDKILMTGDAIMRLLEQYPTVDKIERVIKNSIGESPARATITKHLADVKSQISKQVRLANGINDELPEPVVSAFKILMDYGEKVANSNLESEFQNIASEREQLIKTREADQKLIESLKTQLLLAHSKSDTDLESIVELKNKISGLEEFLSKQEDQHLKSIQSIAEQSAKNQMLETTIENLKQQILSFEGELTASQLATRAMEHERDRLQFDFELLKKENMALKVKQQSDKKDAESMRKMMNEMSATMQAQIKDATNLAREKSNNLPGNTAKFSLKRSSINRMRK